MQRCMYNGSLEAILHATRSLLAPFGLHFGRSGHHSGSIFDLLAPFWLKITFLGTRSRESPTDCRQHPRGEQIPACTMTCRGPRAGICLWQLRSTLEASFSAEKAPKGLPNKSRRVSRSRPGRELAPKTPQGHIFTDLGSILDQF